MTTLPKPRLVDLPAGTSARGLAVDPIRLSVHEAGPTDGPAVVFIHGFPELAHSWRHQVAALAGAGFRAIAPDMRGYGGSDRPEAIDCYDLDHLTADLARLLDALEIERAVFVGHDWGGFVAWGMPIAFPERCLGIIGVNTPYMPFPRTTIMRQMVKDEERLYILWFQRPGVAEAILDRDPRLVFEKLMRGGVAPQGEGLAQRAAGDDPEMDANPFRRLHEIPDAGEPLLSPDELDVYVKAFEETGFRGGINWYRNIDRNADAYPEIGTQKLTLPCLMVTAAWDLALPPSAAAGMPALCSDLETVGIDECGHWTQQDKPEVLDGILVDWLKRRIA
jgi:pimeloyl-ACP methyl ester carboxylesterase